MTSPTPCPTADELSAFFDGECTPAEREAIESHVRACGDCTASMARHRRTSSLLQGLPAERASDDLVRSIARGASAPARPTASVALRMAAVLLIGAVGLAAVLTVRRQLGEPRPAQVAEARPLQRKVASPAPRADRPSAATADMEPAAEAQESLHDALAQPVPHDGPGAKPSLAESNVASRQPAPAPAIGSLKAEGAQAAKLDLAADDAAKRRSEDADVASDGTFAPTPPRDADEGSLAHEGEAEARGHDERDGYVRREQPSAPPAARPGKDAASATSAPPRADTDAPSQREAKLAADLALAKEQVADQRRRASALLAELARVKKDRAALEARLRANEVARGRQAERAAGAVAPASDPFWERSRAQPAPEPVVSAAPGPPCAVPESGFLRVVPRNGVLQEGLEVPGWVTLLPAKSAQTSGPVRVHVRVFPTGGVQLVSPPQGRDDDVQWVSSILGVRRRHPVTCAGTAVAAELHVLYESTPTGWVGYLVGPMP